MCVMMDAVYVCNGVCCLHVWWLLCMCMMVVTVYVCGGGCFVCV